VIIDDIKANRIVHKSAPLPLIPGDAVQIGLGVGLLEDESGGVVFIWGNAALFFSKDDVSARRFAAVQLLISKAAKPGEVASAFKVGPTTLARWRIQYEEAGLQGLIEKKKGPTHPHKLTDEITNEIKSLRKKGKSLREIASSIRCSTYLVRVALGLVEKDLVRPDDFELFDQTSTSDNGDSSDGDGEDSNEQPSSDLLPLPQPEPRNSERTAARFGLLDEAKPVFTQGAGLGRVGTLLILPALEETGLIEVAKDLYKRMSNGFYGLSSTLLMMVFLSLTREPRAEGVTRLSPGEFGRLLGLDRSPEVKTIRRKLRELEEKQLGSQLVTGLAKYHVEKDPESIGYLYVDGHVRVYAGERDLQKNHVTRTRIAAPATLETWVNDSRGDPVFVVTSKISASLVSELRSILPQLRDVVGMRKSTIVFDRGGWSPDLFKELVEAGFDFLTYKKGKSEPIGSSSFVTETFVENNINYTYELNDSIIKLSLSKKVNGNETLECRQVVRRSENGHQISVVTSRRDLKASETLYRMFSRWRQENYFRYGRMHFALDSLDSYKVLDDDTERSVPNPERKALQEKLRKARNLVTGKEAELGKVAYNTEQDSFLEKSQDLTSELIEALKDAMEKVSELELKLADTPIRVPLKTIRPKAALLDEERKLITHAIRLSTYNAESYLARMLIGHFPMDESRALLREVFNSPGDLEIVGKVLNIRIDPLSAPRRTKALRSLCEELNTTKTTYPGTDLVLNYTLKERPGLP